MQYEYKINIEYLKNFDKVILSRFNAVKALMDNLLLRTPDDGFILMTRDEARVLDINTSLGDELIRIDYQCVLRYKDKSGIHLKRFETEEQMDKFIEYHRCKCDCKECPCFVVITEYRNRNFNNN